MKHLKQKEQNYGKTETKDCEVEAHQSRDQEDGLCSPSVTNGTVDPDAGSDSDE